MPPKDPAARAEYMRAYYAANRDRLIERASAWSAAHPERKRAINRAWYASKGREHRALHPDQSRAANRKWYPEKKATANRAQRMRRYGLTISDYEARLAAQGGVCGLCGKTETHKARNGSVTLLAVDHDHATGSVRALLCHACNVGLGSFLDDPVLLEVAAGYVRSFRG